MVAVTRSYRHDGGISLPEHPVRASIGVTDLARAAAFYEGVLCLAVERTIPSPT
jgi:predicted enzyme related to lactoylglutathione lyase